jgi:hypothetical protein
MRVHITLDETDVRRLDDRVGSRRRSRFIAEAVRRALDDAQRWDSIDQAIGKLGDRGHDWDADPAAWVRAQRRSDPRRLG